MISASAVSKRYPEGLEALRDVSFEITAGELVFITGHSGAGKSTLFRLLAAIEKPTSGSIVVGGQNLAALRRSAIPFLRRHFGLIFQDQKLLFDRSVLDNVMLPLDIVGLPHREALRRARAALDKVGLLAREKAQPIALSGGEQQRLAIARVLLKQPAWVLADEATAALDAEAEKTLYERLKALTERGGGALLSIAHRPSVAAFHPRSWKLVPQAAGDGARFGLEAGAV